MKLSVDLPQRVGVEDYHVFSTVELFYKQLNKKIKVREIGFGNGEYVGIAYFGALTHKQNKALIEKLREECKEEEEEYGRW